MEPTITYRIASREDIDEIRKLLRDHFYIDEPMNKAYKSSGDDQDNHEEKINMETLEKHVDKCAVAVCENKIVGVILSKPQEKGFEEQLLKEASQKPNSQWAKELPFLLSLDAHLFDKYKVDKVMRGHAATVHKNFRKLGIAENLVEKVMERAKELGYQVYTAHCTSSYTSKICERFGMKVLNTRKYADYRVPGTGEQIYFPTDEHKVAKSYAKWLTSDGLVINSKL